jgi:STE24 endopeptidase
VADFANLPLLLLVALAASLIVLPVANGYSRRRETAADLFALETTEAPGIFIDAMTKLGRQNLAQTRPHRLIEFLLHSHPSIGRRVDFAHRWEVGR